jgi:hypothetical protein
LFLFGTTVFSAGEFVREAVRKPYIVYNVVLGNQILAEEVDPFKKAGYLESGTCTRAYVKKHYPQVFDGQRIDEKRLLSLAPEDQIAIGEVLFQYHAAEDRGLGRRRDRSESAGRDGGRRQAGRGDLDDHRVGTTWARGRYDGHGGRSSGTRVGWGDGCVASIDP